MRQVLLGPKASLSVRWRVRILNMSARKTVSGTRDRYGRPAACDLFGDRAGRRLSVYRTKAGPDPECGGIRPEFTERNGRTRRRRDSRSNPTAARTRGPPDGRVH